MEDRQRYLEGLEHHRPDVQAACRAALDGAARDADFLHLDRDAFAACQADSIDYAVMGKTDAARVLAIGAGWSDIGSWAAL